ncbi:MAG: nitrate/nitrite transporter NrtS [Pseudomonadota bacterium]
MQKPSPDSFLTIAIRPDVVSRATKIGLIVGTLLTAINHGPALAAGAADLGNLLQILLTYCVPYGVSTYSSVQALRVSA